MRLGGPARAIVDQGLWAFTNLVLVILVANTEASPDDFGLFGIAYGAVVICCGLSNALAGEVLAVTRGTGIRKGAASPAQMGTVIAAVSERAMGMVCSFAVAAPVLSIVVVLPFAAAQPSQNAAWAVAILSPIVVLAEGSRSILYATRRINEALLLSVTWLGVQAVIVMALWYSFGPSSRSAVVAWALGGLGALLVAVRRNPVKPAFRGASPAERRRRLQFGSEYMATALPTQVLGLAAGAMLGLSAAGFVRGLQSLFGPLNVVLAGIRNAIVPAVSEEPLVAKMAGVRVAVLGATVTSLLTVALMVRPDVGTLLMGNSWPRDPWIIAGFGLGRCAVGVVLGALIIFRAWDQGRWSSRLRVVSACGLLLPFVAGALIDLNTAIWASSFVSLLVTVVWWWVALRHHSRSGGSSEFV